MVEPSSLTSQPIFKDMYNYVHVDEKWFFLSRESEKFYLLPEEREPLGTCKSKRFITKVMFLAAVARPRFDATRNEEFSGAIQTLQYQEAPTTIDELVNAVEKSFESLSSENLNQVFLTLQSCMIEVMKVHGGINYKVPHMGKNNEIRQDTCNVKYLFFLKRWKQISSSVDAEASIKLRVAAYAPRLVFCKVGFSYTALLTGDEEERLVGAWVRVDLTLVTSGSARRLPWGCVFVGLVSSYSSLKASLLLVSKSIFVEFDFWPVLGVSVRLWFSALGSRRKWHWVRHPCSDITLLLQTPTPFRRVREIKIAIGYLIV
ncbi:hypothetical protein Vadar_006228 [Vaccinium darrowii]|uniref:Uncharacterized protein n=1 Tax=Vaccinium darrowii TaxID=229202 RepID=A0ACB7X8J2_9ERIC|nr:hypothetical protein Vadar_006228 [Vaccinium darrowii]